MMLISFKKAKVTEMLNRRLHCHFDFHYRIRNVPKWFWASDYFFARVNRFTVQLHGLCFDLKHPFFYRALRQQFYLTSDSERSYFNLAYIPTHMNSGNYFIAIAVGIFYNDMKKKQKDLSNSTVSLVLRLQITFSGNSTELYLSRKRVF